MKTKLLSIGKVDKQMSGDVSKALSAGPPIPKGLKSEDLGGYPIHITYTKKHLKLFEKLIRKSDG